MTTATHDDIIHDKQPGFFARAEHWLDARGKGGWIAALVLGIVLFWPIGLALLAYMIWTKRLFAGGPCMRRSGGHVLMSSGNSAFDTYKAAQMRRLEEEQAQFSEFLQRLRDARDKAEFDQFMQDRKTPATDADK